MEQLNVNNKIMNIVIFSRKEYFNTIFPTLIQISRDSLLSLSTYRKRPVKSSITVKKKSHRHVILREVQRYGQPTPVYL
jgi:hypothetical protein